MKKHSLIFFRFLKQYLVGAQVPQSFERCAKTAYFRTPTKILIYYDRELIFVLLDSSHQDDQFDTLKLHFILKNQQSYLVTLIYEKFQNMSRKPLKNNE